MARYIAAAALFGSLSTAAGADLPPDIALMQLSPDKGLRGSIQ